MALVPRDQRERGTYVGGREAAAISGIGRDSAFDVYARIVHRRQAEQNGAMLRGNLVEPGLADYIRDRRMLGDAAVRDAFYLDDRVPYFGGSVDMVEAPVGSPRVIHEIKTIRSRGRDAWGAPGTPEVEPACAAQVAWYMGITGAQVAHVWAYDMDSDEEPLEYVVPRDDKLIRTLRRNAEEFWMEHILPEIPPTPTARTDPGSVAAVWPTTDESKEVPPTLALIEAAQAYDEARAAEKAAKASKDDAAGILKAAIRDGYRCRWPGGSVCWSAPGLGAEINHEEALRELGELATKAGLITPDGYQSLIRKHTIQKVGTRRLTVSLKRGAK